MNQLDSTAAKNILIYSYGVTEEEANMLIPDNPTTETTTENTDGNE